MIMRPLVVTGLLCLPLMVAAQAPRRLPAVDTLFKAWDRPDSPGCTVGVLRDGRWLYQRGYGSANLDHRLPNGPDKLYYVGSDSKQFTAAAIAMLSLAGRIGLDDDIRRYFPEMPDYGTPVTVRQLVHHTGGLRDIYVLMALAGKRLEDVFTDAEALALIARQKELNFTPGTDHLYSNSGYFLLGQLVKRVTGQSLRVFTDSAIFKPLGMTRTHFHDDPGHVMPGRAMAYEPDGSGGFRLSYIQNFDKVGAGGLYTTLEDLRKWDENFYTRQVGGEALQRLIHERAVLASGDTLPYAFGNNVTSYRGLRTTEHSGALMGFKANIVRFPDQRFTVLAQCNLGTIDPATLSYRIADHFLAARLGPPAPVRPPRPAVARAPGERRAEQQLTGTYHAPEVDATYVIRAAGGQLVMDRPLARTDTLAAYADGTWRADGLTLRFEGQPGVPPGAFTIEAGRVRNIRFVRR